LREKDDELSDIHRNKSFRIGRLITAPFRKARKLFD